MTPVWTVIMLLSVIVAVEFVAIIALTRHVGLLHGPAGTRSAPRQQPWPGPQRGRRLQLDVPPGLIGSQHELILYGFVRPDSGTGTAALSAFTSVAAELPGNERALLVSDGDEARPVPIWPRMASACRCWLARSCCRRMTSQPPRTRSWPTDGAL